MTPDVDTRLETVVTALRQVVLPALPADEPLAREQANLCIGQLSVIAEQYRFATEYEAICLAEILRLSWALLDAAEGGAALEQAVADLRRTAAAAEDASTGTPRDRRNAVARQLDDLLRVGGQDGSGAFRSRSQRLVLEHGVRQSARDRAWFRGCGMDPDAAVLPTIGQMIEEARA
ncbi:hypothetical protein ACQP04_26065 [Pseudonocardia halophobica]|uniref:hypothetical protein n=1 Tax=Pseudonocardia halophobica TaxID=29401 RepID=UPI003D947AE6